MVTIPVLKGFVVPFRIRSQPVPGARLVPQFPACVRFVNVMESMTSGTLLTLRSFTNPAVRGERLICGVLAGDIFEMNN